MGIDSLAGTRPSQAVVAPDVGVSGPKINGTGKPDKPAVTIIENPDFDTFVEKLGLQSEIPDPKFALMTPGQIEALMVKLDTSSETISADISAIQALLYKLLQELRTGDGNRRIDSRKISRESGAVEVQKMEKAANERFAAEVAGAASAIAGGLLQVAVAAGSIGALVSTVKPLKENAKELNKLMESASGFAKKKVELKETLKQMPLDHADRQKTVADYKKLKQDMAANDISITTAQKDAARIDYSVKLASAVSELGGALSSISQGIGRLISAHFNLMASMSDVEAKRSANTKEIADIDQQTANEYMGQWRDLLNQISSNFKEMMMSSIQTETSAAKNMS